MDLRSAHTLVHSKSFYLAASQMTWRCFFVVVLTSLIKFSFGPSSTCFNRIDLPTYSSKKELEERLRQAITLSAVGFDME